MKCKVLVFCYSIMILLGCKELSKKIHLYSNPAFSIDSTMMFLDTGYIEFCEGAFSNSIVPYMSAKNLGRYFDDTLSIEGSFGYPFLSSSIKFLITKNNFEFEMWEHSCLYSQKYSSISHEITLSNWPPILNEPVTIQFKLSLVFFDTSSGLIDTMDISGTTSCIIRNRDITFEDLIREKEYNYFIEKSKNCPDTVKMVSLSIQHLDKLPDELLLFTNLESLDLFYNCINEDQFYKISHLANLQYLSLRSNYLTQVPKEIFNLTELKVLDLSRNQIKNLPHQIVNLSKLEELYLNENILCEFPEDVFKLNSLKILNLSNNNFKRIPLKITTLPNLKELHLYEM